MDTKYLAALDKETEFADILQPYEEKHQSFKDREAFIRKQAEDLRSDAIKSRQEFLEGLEKYALLKGWVVKEDLKDNEIQYNRNTKQVFLVPKMDDKFFKLFMGPVE